MIFCEIIVPMEISILAKFCCFMDTTVWTADIQSCQKAYFLGTGCLRQGGITSAPTETQNTFHAHFEAKKMPLPVTSYTSADQRIYEGHSISNETNYYCSKTVYSINTKLWLLFNIVPNNTYTLVPSFC
jgi:hypothetical protein